MKINRSSWHYRHFASDWDKKPKSLCWYFWKIVLSVIWRGVTVLFGIALGLVFLTVLTFPIWQWFFDYGPDMHLGPFFLWTIIGGVLIYQYRKHLYSTGQLARIHQPVKIRERTLLGEYLHARHRKICPLLEYPRDD